MAIKSIRLLVPVDHNYELIPADTVVSAEQVFGGTLPPRNPGDQPTKLPRTPLDLAKLVARGRAVVVKADKPEDVPPPPPPPPVKDPGESADGSSSSEKGKGKEK